MFQSFSPDIRRAILDAPDPRALSRSRARTCYAACAETAGAEPAPATMWEPRVTARLTSPPTSHSRDARRRCSMVMAACGRVPGRLPRRCGRGSRQARWIGLLGAGFVRSVPSYSVPVPGAALAPGWASLRDPPRHLVLAVPRCKTSSHELVVPRRVRAPRLSPRQSARGAGDGCAHADCGKGAGRVHHCRGGPSGWGQPRRAVPALPRCPGPARRAGRGMERRPVQQGAGVRGDRPRLSRVRARAAGLLRGDVRGADRFCRASRAVGGRGSGVWHAARGGGAAGRRAAAGPAATVADGGTAYLGDGARDCVAVCARQPVAAKAADVTGGSAGGGGCCICRASGWRVGRCEWGTTAWDGKAQHIPPSWNAPEELSVRLKWRNALRFSALRPPRIRQWRRRSWRAGRWPTGRG